MTRFGQREGSLMHCCSAILDVEWQLIFNSDLTFAFNLTGKY